MSDKLCTKCKIVKPISNFYKDKQRPDGLHSHCKDCHSNAGKKYYNNNKDSVLAKNKKWHDENRDYHNKINLENNRSNRIKNPDGWREYYNKNKAQYTARTAKRRAKKLMATPEWADLDWIKEYYIGARKLGLHVDHIVPLQSEVVCGLHCEDNLQLLPAAVNIRKSNRFKVGG